MRPWLLRDHYHIRYMTFRWQVLDCHYFFERSLNLQLLISDVFSFINFHVSHTVVALWSSVLFFLKRDSFNSKNTVLTWICWFSLNVCLPYLIKNLFLHYKHSESKTLKKIRILFPLSNRTFCNNRMFSICATWYGRC